MYTLTFAELCLTTRQKTLIFPEAEQLDNKHIDI